jgi:hypothetical protein
MLAYVFWHWRRPEVARDEYEQRQQRFHAALRATPSAGFRTSLSAAIQGAPWAASGKEAYEDWYLLEDAAALDPLNEAAVSAPRQHAHDAAAAAADGGTAGLYRVRRGTVSDEAPTFAAWFAKPAGMPYAELYSAVEPLLRSSGGALWCRQMVLGPTPEFCLQSAAPVVLPAPITPLVIQLRRIWPPPTP